MARRKPTTDSTENASMLAPPIEPMLAKLADNCRRRRLLYEPKWDGFRSSSFAAARTKSSFKAASSSRSIRYFPGVARRVLRALPAGCVLDGEIVIATDRGLDFDALQMRLHPAASRGEAGEGDAGGLRGVRPARGRSRGSAPAVRPSGARGWSACWRTPCRRST